MISNISSAQDTSAANAALQGDIRLVKANAPRQPAPETHGGGPYPALLEIDPNLPNYVVYRPENLDALGHKKLGIIIWGNGGCTDDAAMARHHLIEIASHGYLAIASGKMLSGPQAGPNPAVPTYLATTKEVMKKALDWTMAENGRKGGRYYQRLDPSAVAISGTSCGGILSIMLAPDPRVKAIILHNSGLFPNRANRPELATNPAMLDAFHTPVLYVLGNRTDIAWSVATDDFVKINKVPVMFASLKARGHGGTFEELNGGAAAKIALDWLEWQLHGDKQAAKTFIGKDCRLCVDPAWTVQRKGFGDDIIDAALRPAPVDPAAQAAAEAAAASAARTNAAAAAAGFYTTTTTRIGDLLGDPTAKSIVAKYAPFILSSPSVIYPQTLKQLQFVAATTLSDKMLTDMDVEFLKLPPKK
jgi:hypothetical protein